MLFFHYETRSFFTSFRYFCDCVKQILYANVTLFIRRGVFNCYRFHCLKRKTNGAHVKKIGVILNLYNRRNREIIICVYNSGHVKKIILIHTLKHGNINKYFIFGSILALQLTHSISNANIRVYTLKET